MSESASKLAEDAKREGAAKVDQLRGSTSHKVDTLAESARAAAAALKQDDVAHMSRYLEQMAESMQRLSGSLRDKSGDELLHEVTRIARENPALFMTGCVAVGFGLGRFARASRPESRAMTSPADLQTGTAATEAYTGSIGGEAGSSTMSDDAGTSASQAGFTQTRPGGLNS